MKTWYSESHTQPYWLWMNAWAELLFFENFVVELAKQADSVMQTAATALLQYGPPMTPDKRARMEIQKEHGGGVTAAYHARHARVMAEMLSCRIVDNFLVYVSALLALVFKNKPETLRSGEHVRLDFVLGYGTMEELLSALADRKVNELSYRGMRDLHKFISEHLGFELFVSNDDLEVAIEAIERRNLIVHNRGMVSATSANRVASLRDHVGKLLDTSTTTNSRYGLFFEDKVRAADLRAIEKFQLPSSPMKQQSPQPIDSHSA